MLKYYLDHHKISDHFLDNQIIIKNIPIFFNPSIRMSGKGVSFGDKKIKKKKN